MTLPSLLRLSTLAVPGCLLILSACAHNRVELAPYVPRAGTPGASYRQTLFEVAPLADHRFRLYSYAPSDMVDTVGWGQGTGTIYTPQNIPEHVTKALVSQFRRDGMNVAYGPGLRCRIRGPSDHPRIRVAGTPRRSLVLCGAILDYQFQLDHPRINFGGMISTLDMAAGATLSAQASLRLFLVEARSGRILWSGVLGSAGEKKGLRPPHLKAQSLAYLDGRLARVLAKAAVALSRAGE